MPDWSSISGWNVLEEKKGFKIEPMIHSNFFQASNLQASRHHRGQALDTAFIYFRHIYPFTLFNTLLEDEYKSLYCRERWSVWQ